MANFTAFPLSAAVFSPRFESSGLSTEIIAAFDFFEEIPAEALPVHYCSCSNLIPLEFHFNSNVLLVFYSSARLCSSADFPSFKMS